MESNINNYRANPAFGDQVIEMLRMTKQRCDLGKEVNDLMLKTLEVSKETMVEADTLKAMASAFGEMQRTCGDAIGIAIHAIEGRDKSLAELRAPAPDVVEFKTVQERLGVLLRSGRALIDNDALKEADPNKIRMLVVAQIGAIEKMIAHADAMDRKVRDLEDRVSRQA